MPKHIALKMRDEIKAFLADLTLLKNPNGLPIDEIANYLAQVEIARTNADTIIESLKKSTDINVKNLVIQFENFNRELITQEKSLDTVYNIQLPQEELKINKETMPNEIETRGRQSLHKKYKKELNEKLKYGTAVDEKNKIFRDFWGEKKIRLEALTAGKKEITNDYKRKFNTISGNINTTAKIINETELKGPERYMDLKKEYVALQTNLMTYQRADTHWNNIVKKKIDTKPSVKLGDYATLEKKVIAAGMKLDNWLNDYIDKSHDSLKEELQEESELKKEYQKLKEEVKPVFPPQERKEPLPTVKTASMELTQKIKNYTDQAAAFTQAMNEYTHLILITTTSEEINAAFKKMAEQDTLIKKIYQTLKTDIESVITKLESTSNELPSEGQEKDQKLQLVLQELTTMVNSITQLQTDLDKKFELSVQDTQKRSNEIAAEQQAADALPPPLPPRPDADTDLAKQTAQQPQQPAGYTPIPKFTEQQQPAAGETQAAQSTQQSKATYTSSKLAPAATIKTEQQKLDPVIQEFIQNFIATLSTKKIVSPYTLCTALGTLGKNLQGKPSIRLLHKSVMDAYQQLHNLITVPAETKVENVKTALRDFSTEVNKYMGNENADAVKITQIIETAISQQQLATTTQKPLTLEQAFDKFIADLPQSKELINLHFLSEKLNILEKDLLNTSDPKTISDPKKSHLQNLVSKAKTVSIVVFTIGKNRTAEDVDSLRAALGNLEAEVKLYNNKGASEIISAVVNNELSLPQPQFNLANSIADIKDAIANKTKELNSYQENGGQYGKLLLHDIANVKNGLEEIKRLTKELEILADPKSNATAELITAKLDTINQQIALYDKNLKFAKEAGQSLFARTHDLVNMIKDFRGEFAKDTEGFELEDKNALDTKLREMENKIAAPAPTADEVATLITAVGDYKQAFDKINSDSLREEQQKLTLDQVYEKFINDFSATSLSRALINLKGNLGTHISDPKIDTQEISRLRVAIAKILALDDTEEGNLNAKTRNLNAALGDFYREIASYWGIATKNTGQVLVIITKIIDENPKQQQQSTVARDASQYIPILKFKQPPASPLVQQNQPVPTPLLAIQVRDLCKTLLGDLESFKTRNFDNYDINAMSYYSATIRNATKDIDIIILYLSGFKNDEIFSNYREQLKQLKETLSSYQKNMSEHIDSQIKSSIPPGVIQDTLNEGHSTVREGYQNSINALYEKISTELADLSKKDLSNPFHRNQYNSIQIDLEFLALECRKWSEIKSKSGISKSAYEFMPKEKFDDLKNPLKDIGKVLDKSLAFHIAEQQGQLKEHLQTEILQAKNDTIALLDLNAAFQKFIDDFSTKDPGTLDDTLNDLSAALDTLEKDLFTHVSDPKISSLHRFVLEAINALDDERRDANDVKSALDNLNVAVLTHLGTTNNADQVTQLINNVINDELPQLQPQQKFTLYDVFDMFIRESSTTKKPEDLSSFRDTLIKLRQTLGSINGDVDLQDSILRVVNELAPGIDIEVNSLKTALDNLSREVLKHSETVNNAEDVVTIINAVYSGLLQQQTLTLDEVFQKFTDGLSMERPVTLNNLSTALINFKENLTNEKYLNHLVTTAVDELADSANIGMDGLKTALSNISQEVSKHSLAAPNASKVVDIIEIVKNDLSQQQKILNIFETLNGKLTQACGNTGQPLSSLELTAARDALATCEQELEILKIDTIEPLIVLLEKAKTALSNVIAVDDTIARYRLQDNLTKLGEAFKELEKSNALSSKTLVDIPKAIDILKSKSDDNLLPPNPILAKLNSELSTSNDIYTALTSVENWSSRSSEYNDLFYHIDAAKQAIEDYNENSNLATLVIADEKIDSLTQHIRSINPPPLAAENVIIDLNNRERPVLEYNDASKILEALDEALSTLNSHPDSSAAILRYAPNVLGKIIEPLKKLAIDTANHLDGEPASFGLDAANCLVVLQKSLVDLKNTAPEHQATKVSKVVAAISDLKTEITNLQNIDVADMQKALDITLSALETHIKDRAKLPAPDSALDEKLTLLEKVVKNFGNPNWTDGPKKAIEEFKKIGNEFPLRGETRDKLLNVAEKLEEFCNDNSRDNKKEATKAINALCEDSAVEKHNSSLKEKLIILPNKLDNIKPKVEIAAGAGVAAVKYELRTEAARTLKDAYAKNITDRKNTINYVKENFERQYRGIVARYEAAAKLARHSDVEIRDLSRILEECKQRREALELYLVYCEHEHPGNSRAIGSIITLLKTLNKTIDRYEPKKDTLVTSLATLSDESENINVDIKAHPNALNDPVIAKINEFIGRPGAAGSGIEVRSSLPSYTKEDNAATVNRIRIGQTNVVTVQHTDTAKVIHTNYYRNLDDEKKFKDKDWAKIAVVMVEQHRHKAGVKNKNIGINQGTPKELTEAIIKYCELNKLAYINQTPHQYKPSTSAVEKFDELVKKNANEIYGEKMRMLAYSKPQTERAEEEIHKGEKSTPPRQGGAGR